MNKNWNGYETLDNLKSDLGPVLSCYYIIVGKAPERQPTSFSKFPIILLKFTDFLTNIQVISQVETNCSKCSAMLDPNPFWWCSSKSLVKEQRQSLLLAHMNFVLCLKDTREHLYIKRNQISYEYLIVSTE